MRKSLSISVVLILIALLAVVLVGPATASPPSQQSDPVEHGKYLATIAGCGGCHTPLGPNGAPDASKAFSGGQEFDLGPLGKLLTPNLTSDKETGLGDWTDDEIKLAIRSGVRPDGGHMFPVMPYVTYSTMAEADLDAIVAFLRTLPPVTNSVPFKQLLPNEALPQVSIQTGIVAPDPADTAARGKYLLNSVIACTDCHTPVDEQTGAPIREKYFGGGQPYEGPWGIVYAGNITPDKETGIGNWSDDQIKRVFREGVRIDGRRVVLMSWQEFSVLTDDDLNAVVYYLRNDVPAVKNQVPANALNPEFVQYAEVNTTPTGPSVAQIALMVIGALVVIVGVIVMIVMAQRGNKPTPPAAK
jgi:mono/diheme cytochrome c family protein